MERLNTRRAFVPEDAQGGQRGKRILLGQLVSNGDCLYATTIAHQIKHDNPDCHLTWAIGSVCRSILNNNPHVDEVWEIPLSRVGEGITGWQQFEREAVSRKNRGDFDEIFLTQVSPSNLHKYAGTIRSAIFRAYTKPLTVPIAPVLRLSSIEVENVRSFAEVHQLHDQPYVILFECSPKSGQSFLTPDYALEVAEKLVARRTDICLILSSNVSISSTNRRIVDGSVLSLRENAELTKYCSLLIGGSSGVSWIATSDWAKPLPMIQLLKPDALWFNSFTRDYEQWGLATNAIIEMSDCPADKLCKCVETILSAGFDSTRLAFHEQIPLTFGFFRTIQDQLLQEGQYKKSVRSLLLNIEQHGFKPELLVWHCMSLIKCPFRFLFRMVSSLKFWFLIRIPSPLKSRIKIFCSYLRSLRKMLNKSKSASDREP